MLCSLLIPACAALSLCELHIRRASIVTSTEHTEDQPSHRIYRQSAIKTNMCRHIHIYHSLCNHIVCTLYPTQCTGPPGTCARECSTPMSHQIPAHFPESTACHHCLNRAGAHQTSAGWVSYFVTDARAVKFSLEARMIFTNTFMANDHGLLQRWGGTILPQYIHVDGPHSIQYDAHVYGPLNYVRNETIDLVSTPMTIAQGRIVAPAPGYMNAPTPAPPGAAGMSMAPPPRPHQAGMMGPPPAPTMRPPMGMAMRPPLAQAQAQHHLPVPPEATQASPAAPPPSSPDRPRQDSGVGIESQPPANCSEDTSGPSSPPSVSAVDSPRAATTLAPAPLDPDELGAAEWPSTFNADVQGETVSGSSQPPPEQSEDLVARAESEGLVLPPQPGIAVSVPAVAQGQDGGLVVPGQLERAPAVAAPEPERELKDIEITLGACLAGFLNGDAPWP